MVYQMPHNFTRMQQYASWANIVTGGWFWTLVLIAFVLVMLFALKGRYSNERAFGGAIYGGLLGSIILNMVALVPRTTVAIFLILSIVMVFVLYYSNRRD